MRRSELWLAIGVMVVLAIVAWAGRRSAPGDALDDPRASTLRSGPRGARGLAQALRRLGVQVRQSRRPLFGLAQARAGAADAHTIHAFLDIFVPPEEEIAEVRDLVERGGRVFVAGFTGIERCFGYASRYLGSDRWESLEEPIAVAAPAETPRLPGTRRVMERLPAESLFAEKGRATDCELLRPTDRKVLLSTSDGRPVALALGFSGGGEALLLADVTFTTNRALRETDAGLLVIPWLLEGGVRRVVFDEFHQGFGSERTVWDLAGAALAWLASRPPGWAVLQLVVVGLLTLAMMSIRFGPARAGVERRRRSPAEHVEALAAGLQGSGTGGQGTAVELVVNGLRRRLSRTGRWDRGSPSRGDGDWLAALELALPDARGKGRQAARQLRRLLANPSGEEHAVLEAGQAVEDVWEELRPRTTRV